MEKKGNKFVVLYEPFSQAIDFNGVNTICYVEDSLNCIEDYFSTYNLPEKPMPHVFLDSEHLIEDCYGKYTKQEIINFLKEYSEDIKKKVSKDFLDDFNSIISSIIDYLGKRSEDTNNNAWDEILNVIDKLRQRISEKRSRADKRALDYLVKMLSEQKKDNLPRLGAYYPGRHQIVLYLRAIEDTDKKQDIHGMIYLVLAHEFFHAMHYALDPESLLWDSSSSKKKNKTEIKEALADCFSVLCCYKSYNKSLHDVAADRFESWKRNLYSSWPYAKAILLMKERYSQSIPTSLNSDCLFSAVENMKEICNIITEDNYRRASNIMHGINRDTDSVIPYMRATHGL